MGADNCKTQPASVGVRTSGYAHALTCTCTSGSLVVNQPGLGADSRSSDLPSISLVSQKYKSIKTLWRSKAEGPDRCQTLLPNRP